MLPLGHLSAAYLLTQTSKKLSLKEVLLILLAGIVLDFDIFLGIALNKSHHDLITHTPFGAIIVWLILIFIFSKSLSGLGKVLVLASLFLHLILDEAGYWLYSLGLQSIINQPQISWFYPLKPLFDKLISSSFYSIGLFVWIYLNNARANVLLEIILFLTALIIFILNRCPKRKNSKNC